MVLTLPLGEQENVAEGGGVDDGGRGVKKAKGGWFGGLTVIV